MVKTQKQGSRNVIKAWASESKFSSTSRNTEWGKPGFRLFNKGSFKNSLGFQNATFCKSHWHRGARQESSLMQLCCLQQAGRRLERCGREPHLVMSLSNCSRTVVQKKGMNTLPLNHSLQQNLVNKSCLSCSINDQQVTGTLARSPRHPDKYQRIVDTVH